MSSNFKKFPFMDCKDEAEESNYFDYLKSQKNKDGRLYVDNSNIVTISDQVVAQETAEDIQEIPFAIEKPKRKKHKKAKKEDEEVRRHLCVFLLDAIQLIHNRGSGWLRLLIDQFFRIEIMSRLFLDLLGMLPKRCSLTNSIRRCFHSQPSKTLPSSSS